MRDRAKATDVIRTSGSQQAKFFFNFGDRRGALYCDCNQRGGVLAAIAERTNRIRLGSSAMALGGRSSLCSWFFDR
jgi:hypothetical protein